MNLRNVLLCALTTIAVACGGDITDAPGIALPPAHGGPNCDSTYRCHQAVAPGGRPERLCSWSKTGEFYQALRQCACGARSEWGREGCKTSCADSACTGIAATPTCTECISMRCPEDLHACNLPAETTGAAP